MNKSLLNLTTSVVAGMMMDHTNSTRPSNGNRETMTYMNYVPPKSQKTNIEDETLEQFHARHEEMKKRYMRNKANGKISI